MPRDQRNAAHDHRFAAAIDLIEQVDVPLRRGVRHLLPQLEDAVKQVQRRKVGQLYGATETAPRRSTTPP